MDLWTAYQQAQRLTRAPLAILRRARDEDDREALRDAWGYLSRQADIAAVRDLMRSRFAVGVRTNTVDNGTGTPTLESESYTRESDAARVEQGQWETVSGALGQRIARARATLFTQAGQRYQYTSEDGESVDESAADAVRTVREAGGYLTALVEADVLACSLGSGLLHVYWQGERLRYEPISPADVYLVYGQRVDTETSRGTISRGVHRADLEDASAVILRTAGGVDGSGACEWLAYVGRCADWPDGRMVSYRAREPWPLPAPGPDGVSDYRHSDADGVSNPLTYLADHGAALADLSRCEYPLVVIDGGLVTDHSTPVPTTTSLYESALECELAWSRLLSYALQGARGKDVFERDAASSPRLPRNLDIITLEPGQHYRVDGRSAGESASAVEVVRAVARTVADGASVPGYLLIADGSVVPESGIALAIRTQPLLDDRARRARTNTAAVARLFDIERALLAEYTGQAVIAAGTVQTWTPGELELQRDMAAEGQRLQQALTAQLIDQVAAVREYHRLASDDEALALIEQYAARDAQYQWTASGV